MLGAIRIRLYLYSANFIENYYDKQRTSTSPWLRRIQAHGRTDGAKASIPAQKGVYVVLRENETNPQFLAEGTGGFFKGKNPNVPLDELEDNWVEGTSILYIGKSGGAGSSATLQKRLGQYLRFGQGVNIGHWGGRYIWQLADSRDLVVCWKVLPDDEPREVERQMISEIKAVHGGKRPFANLMD